MSTVTATALADTLPLTVPKLKATGLNWTIFLLRFQDAMKAKGYWGHFDGTEPRPVITQSSPSLPSTSATTAASTTVASLTTEELTAMAQWDKDERSAKSLLTQKIPNSALICI